MEHLDANEGRGWRIIRNVLAILGALAWFFTWSQVQGSRVTTLENNDSYFKEQLREMKESAQRDRTELRDDIKEIKRLLQEDRGPRRKTAEGT
jgi:hypothetical protein